MSPNHPSGASLAPPPPGFGEPLPIQPSPETVALLARRRSASASVLGPPGPSGQEIELLLRLASRVPDHGKLAPWRFILLAGEHKDAWVARLGAIAQTRPDAEKASAALGKAGPSPLCVVIVSRAAPHPKIPEWEQFLSAGAVNMNLLLAAHALGYGANWITDWYSEDAGARALLGVAAGEQITGHIYIGAPAATPLERPRPDLEQLVTVWRAGDQPRPR
ncbi:MAG: nitroreductase [Proteobacteria bacterium]|nr:nitroreductase [Pseudomonadota bacterium]